MLRQIHLQCRDIVNTQQPYLYNIDRYKGSFASTLLLRIQKEYWIISPSKQNNCRKKKELGFFYFWRLVYKDEEEASGDKTEKNLLHYDYFFEQRPLR